MKNQILQLVTKTTFIVLLLALFGFQQSAFAQLTVVNNTNCWILVGEAEGPNCTWCNNPAGTWIPGLPQATVTMPNQFTFAPTCTGTGTVVSPFPPTAQQQWIGVKYGVVPFSSPFPLPGSIGAGSFTVNPNYPTGPCFTSANVSTCNGNGVTPFWVLNNPVTGASTVTFF